MKFVSKILVVTLMLSSYSWCEENKENEAESKAAKFSFSKPVRMEADGKLISTEMPGYASPCLADMDGDGLKDLLVGQFNGGKIMHYKNEGDGKFAAGEFLRADGETAEIPGVW